MVLKISTITKERIIKTHILNNILNKIQSCKRKYWFITNFTNNIDKSIKENNKITIFKELVQKWFRHYFLLELITHNHSSIILATSLDIILIYTTKVISINNNYYYSSNN